MRGAPKSGLARLIARISGRISGVRLGLPARRPRFPAPERTEARSMPADKGLRLDDRDGIQDAWCDLIQADEDQTITWAEIG